MVLFSGATKYSFVFLRRISELNEFELPLLPRTSRIFFLTGVYEGHLKITERDITGGGVYSIDL